MKVSPAIASAVLVALVAAAGCNGAGRREPSPDFAGGRIRHGVGIAKADEPVSFMKLFADGEVVGRMRLVPGGSALRRTGPGESRAEEVILAMVEMCDEEGARASDQYIAITPEGRFRSATPDEVEAVKSALGEK